MEHLNEKEKQFVRNIHLIYFGLFGLIFLSVQTFVNRKNFDNTSAIDWAIIALVSSIFASCLIWGSIGFRARKVHFKKDNKTRTIVTVGLLLSILGFTLIAVGEFLVFSFLSPEGAVQGIVLFLIGAIFLASTVYLYDRFIQRQIKETHLLDPAQEVVKTDS